MTVTSAIRQFLRRCSIAIRREFVTGAPLLLNLTHRFNYTTNKDDD